MGSANSKSDKLSSKIKDLYLSLTYLNSDEIEDAYEKFKYLLEIEENTAFKFETMISFDTFSKNISQIQNNPFNFRIFRVFTKHRSSFDPSDKMILMTKNEFEDHIADVNNIPVAGRVKFDGGNDNDNENAFNDEDYNLDLEDGINFNDQVDQYIASLRAHRNWQEALNLAGNNSVVPVTTPLARNPSVMQNEIQQVAGYLFEDDKVTEVLETESDQG